MCDVDQEIRARPSYFNIIRGREWGRVSSGCSRMGSSRVEPDAGSKLSPQWEWSVEKWSVGATGEYEIGGPRAEDRGPPRGTTNAGAAVAAAKAESGLKATFG